MEACWLCKKIIRPWHLVRKGMLGIRAGVPALSEIVAGEVTSHIGCWKRYKRVLIWTLVIFVFTLVACITIMVMTVRAHDARKISQSLQTGIMIVPYILVILSPFLTFFIGHFFNKRKIKKLDLADRFIDQEIKTRIEKEDKLMDLKLQKIQKAKKEQDNPEQPDV
ncbi:hypothetical protein [Williamsoniiplasma luminosum]|uniref:Uncharacterized protein n=1 Tax=Williamsoniiplasma luminosum TaxID=214888 RepID=A0A2S0NK71_9MOLU|nr:hypothetical protein [Williamsoniiplasma luminosum]AVP49404.1 MAG: hypothetical protein C5T88_02345 [Williamsoniiplasma luminosum]